MGERFDEQNARFGKMQASI